MKTEILGLASDQGHRAGVAVPSAARPGGIRLSPASLAELAGEVAAAPASWQPIVQFSEERRWFRRLELTPDELGIACFEDLRVLIVGDVRHSRVARSEVLAYTALGAHVTLAAPGSRRIRHRTALAGSVTPFGRRHLHDVSNVAAVPAVSVHAYSPPLTAMRRYEMAAGGLAHVGTDWSETDW